MGIRLSLLTEPVIVPFPPPYDGVWIKLRRLTSLELAAAGRRALAVLEKVRDGADALAPYGLADVDASGARLDTADLGQMTGMGELLGAVESALAGFIAWGGVTDDDGNAAPIDRATLTVFLMDDAVRRFVIRKLDEAARILVIEGNGSGPSANGSSATAGAPSAPATAAPASPPPPPAPAEA